LIAIKIKLDRSKFVTSKKLRSSRKFLVVFPLLPFLVVLGQAGTAPSIWESNLGSPVVFSPNGDDGTAVVNFGFAFPFLGNTYTSGSVSSNGYLWLNPANTDAGCCSGDVAGFLAGDPRIAGGWFDQNSSAGGSVDFNTFAGNRAVITFVGVPEFGHVGSSNTYQIQLLSSGRIIFGYNSFLTPALGSDMLIGVTPGNGAADPGSSDLLNGTPFTSSGGTVYQWIASSGAFAPTALSTFEGSNVIFDPNGSGWNVTNQDQPAAAATPEPASFGMLGLGAIALLGWARRRSVRHNSN
jgi:hypothetical protein